jgi:hypothetical protein
MKTFNVTAQTWDNTIINFEIKISSRELCELVLNTNSLNGSNDIAEVISIKEIDIDYDNITDLINNDKFNGFILNVIENSDSKVITVNEILEKVCNQFTIEHDYHKNLLLDIISYTLDDYKTVDESSFDEIKFNIDNGRIKDYVYDTVINYSAMANDEWNIEKLVKDVCCEFGFDDDSDKTVLTEYIKDLEINFVGNVFDTETVNSYINDYSINDFIFNAIDENCGGKYKNKKGMWEIEILMEDCLDEFGIEYGTTDEMKFLYEYIEDLEQEYKAGK